MILNLCLICHDSASNYEIGDIHSKKYSNFKLCLETILKRRIRVDKFQEKQICALCFELVKEHQSLEEKLAKICKELCGNFQRIHPTKRGRKKKEDSEPKEDLIKQETDTKDIKLESNVELSENEAVRKSGRKRKIKEIEVYVDPEEEFFDNSDERSKNIKKIKEEPPILSSMATKCPHCDFAADSDIQVHNLNLKLITHLQQFYVCDDCLTTSRLL